MAIKIFPTQEEGFTELRAFLQSILPPGIEIVVGQANRVPMPPGKDFVVMTPLHRPRLATNVDTNSDTRLIGSISGTTLTATEVDYGKIVAGRQLFGVDVAANTTVVQQLTGTPPGGVGTYKVTPAQTVTSQLMACGVQDLVQKTEVTFQVDVYGPLSGDNAQTISTLLRDDYGFQAMGPSYKPLYTNDPKQIPLVSGEDQYIDRWMVETCLEADITVEVPQQFAEHLTPTLIDVDAKYPP